MQRSSTSGAFALDSPPMGGEGLLRRVSAAGAAAQASVPGAYAWGVTVVPCVWGRGASGTAKLAAVAAIVALVAGVAGERRWGARARVGSLWGFVVSSAITWSIAPSGLSPLRLEGQRAMAGMLGWALFALVSAAPALPALPEGQPPLSQLEDEHASTGSDASRGEGDGTGDEASSTPRRGRNSPAHGVRGDWAYLLGASTVAAVLQTIGWRVEGVERALLVRLVSLAAGLSLIGAATQVTLARHARRTEPSRSRRLRRTVPTLVALVLLAAVGLLFYLRD